MNGLLAALQFLTVLPIHRQFEVHELGRSLVWFPGAGLIVGLGAGLVYGVTQMLGMPDAVAALAGVLGLAIFSGCLHLDGVADTADGFFSSRPREKMLDIMRDSRIGTMGVIGLFTVLAFKWAALTALNPDKAWQVIVMAPVAGRTGQVLSMKTMPYARSGGGLASVFLEYCSRQTAIKAALFCLVTALLLCGTKGIWALCLAVGFGIWFNRWCLSKIGGMTGDTLGAVSEGIEAVVMCAMCMGV